MGEQLIQKIGAINVALIVCGVVVLGIGLKGVITGVTTSTEITFAGIFGGPALVYCVFTKLVNLW